MHHVASPDGTAIAYWRSGDGPPLLLIHGAVADHTRWTPLLGGFEQRYAVFTVDRRGRGGSGDTAPYTIEREYEDVAAVIDAIDTPVHVVGHSFGAVCALMVPRYTSNIRSLVLYEPPPLGGPDLMPPSLATQLRNLIDRGDRDGAVALFLREIAHMAATDVEMMRTMPSWQGRIDAAHTIMREVVDLPRLSPYQADDLQSITVPVLMLLGGISVEPYVGTTRYVDAHLPNSRIVELPGQGHAATTTAPELFTREVLAFLATVPG
jgi:pimeloyl-ACP methyl ester carboxylesterase